MRPSIAAGMPLPLLSASKRRYGVGVGKKEANAGAVADCAGSVGQRIVFRQFGWLVLVPLVRAHVHLVGVGQLNRSLVGADVAGPSSPM